MKRSRYSTYLALHTMTAGVLLTGGTLASCKGDTGPQGEPGLGATGATGLTGVPPAYTEYGCSTGCTVDATGQTGMIAIDTLSGPIARDGYFVCTIAVHPLSGAPYQLTTTSIGFASGGTISIADTSFSDGLLLPCTSGTYYFQVVAECYDLIQYIHYQFVTGFNSPVICG